MTGLIWFVQIVHYPLFARVDGTSWSGYHSAHCRRTGFIVLPIMLLEILSAGALLVFALPLRSSWIYGALCLLLALIWLSTALLQAPLHYQLRPHPGRDLIIRLVRENWIRTISWSLRTIGLGWLIFSCFSSAD